MAKTKIKTQETEQSALVDAPGTEIPVLENILISNIIPSPLNPRKEINHDEIMELAQSILKVGVIQPIVVRPSKDQPGKYELVCGERRYLAAQSVNAAHKTRNTMPASVRNLTDAEAMELMITENLQRKDVHPMEEANAFQYMLDNMNYQVLDIAAKIGKNEAFVVRRLQLLKLIADLQTIFKANDLNIGHAELLSRIDAGSQKLWFDDKYSSKWNGGQGSIKDLRDWLKNKTENRLKDARFKTDTPYEGKQFVCDRCTVCPQNSAFNNSLFPDTADQAICHNPHCYDAKTSAEFEIKLKKALDDPKVILVNDGYGSVDKLEKKLKADGFSVLKGWSQFQELRKPDLYKRGGETEESFTERKKIAAKEYEDQKAKSVKAFSIDTGRYINIIIKQLNDGAAVENKADLARETLIADVEQKRKRGRELDAEKIMKKQVAIINELTYIKEPDKELTSPTPVEYNALLCLAWQKCGYNARGIIRKALKMKETYGEDYTDYAKILSAEPHIKTFIIRNAVFHNFNSITPTNINGAVLNALMEHWSPDEFNQINLDQTGIRQRREAKLDQKIKDFNNQEKEPAEAEV